MLIVDKPMTKSQKANKSKEKIVEYLVEERRDLMKYLSNKGFSQSDIGRIFRVDKSVVHRTLWPNQS